MKSKSCQVTQNFISQESDEQNESEDTDSEPDNPKPPLAEGHYFIKNIGLDTYIHTESKVSLKDNTTGSPARVSAFKLFTL
jgi:hypothetical protein